MQVFFEIALLQSPNGNLARYARVVVCLETFRLYLEGEVRSYYVKQLVQEACLLLAWYYGLEIFNNMQVRKP